jgi:plastocyanin
VRRMLLAAALAAALVAVPVASGATTLKISAVPPAKLAFNKKALTAKAGKVTIVMTNPSVLPHNVALRNGVKATSKFIVKGKVVGKGGVSKVTATLKKGKYRFLCSVPGHEKGGMWGILTVK